MPIIKLLTKIRAPKEKVFDLARNIDLHKESTKQTNEEAIAGVTTGLIGMNQTVTWRAKHLGVYQKLTVKITAFDRPNYFVDEMVKGAFKRFRHEHIFKEEDETTHMIDVFDYDSPLGILGVMADKLFLEKYMTTFLSQRNELIKEMVERESI